jgi:hypothetical protein
MTERQDDRLEIEDLTKIPGLLGPFLLMACGSISDASIAYCELKAFCIIVHYD